MQPVNFVISQTDGSLTTHSGLALVGQMLRRTDLAKRLDAIPLQGRLRPEVSHGEVAAAMIGLLCLGKPDYEAIEYFGGSHHPFRCCGCHLSERSDAGDRAWLGAPLSVGLGPEATSPCVRIVVV